MRTLLSGLNRSNQMHSVTLFSAVLTAVLITVGLYDNTMASNCCGTSSSGGPRVGAFSGNILQPGDFLDYPSKDSLVYFGSLYGYYGNSWSLDGHNGDPLGTGGKWPLIYVSELFREQNMENQALFKSDLRVQYSDFGYIPVWRANTLSGFSKWRLSPELQAKIQLVYGGDPGKPGANSNGSLGVGEVSLQWTPISMPNFWIKAGNIVDGGTYTAIFDQSPLENFIYTGIVTSFRRNIGSSVQSVTSLSIGGNFLNSTYFRDTEAKLPAGSPGFIRASRQRTFAYAKTNILINNALGLKFIGGVQSVPEDSSLKLVAKADTDPYYHYRGEIGGMGGLEATWFGHGQSHSLVISGAYGNALIGSSAPDFILKASQKEPVVLDRSEFSYDPFAFQFTRNKSSLLNLIYWNGTEIGKFHFSGGVWYTARIPGSSTMSFVNPMTDSIRNTHPDPLMKDSIITIAAEPFHAFKISLLPTWKVGYSPLFLGIRYDFITYLTPDAHTNALELERDQTLRPVNDTYNSLYGPSKWEREAVNVNIITPTVRLDFKELGGITVAYSHAIYAKPVDRQGTVNDKHDNLTISADVSITTKKIKQLFP